MRLGRLDFPVPVFLAPMAGVTDMAYRILVHELGCPLVYTEMVSTNGINYRNERTLKMLQTDPRERPLAMQLFGNEPEAVARAAAYVESLGVADVIADVVSTGRTLRQHGLAPFGEPLINSEAIVVARTGAEITPEMMVLLRRMEGILHAHNFLMLDYNVEHHLLEQAKAITPGISGPTVSPLALDNWVAVRAMVPKPEANAIMDRLAHLGAQAILATEIRIARL